MYHAVVVLNFLLGMMPLLAGTGEAQARKDFISLTIDQWGGKPVAYVLNKDDQAYGRVVNRYAINIPYDSAYNRLSAELKTQGWEDLGTCFGSTRAMSLEDPASLWRLEFLSFQEENLNLNGKTYMCLVERVRIPRESTLKWIKTLQGFGFSVR